MRKHDVDKINLKVIDIVPFVNKVDSGFVIQWNSDIGFGEYTIYKSKNSDGWKADAETMDNDNDKAFIKKLMGQFIDNLKII